MARHNHGRNELHPFPLRMSQGERDELARKARVARVPKAAALRMALAAWQPPPRRELTDEEREALWGDDAGHVAERET